MTLVHVCTCVLTNKILKTFVSGKFSFGWNVEASSWSMSTHKYPISFGIVHPCWMGGRIYCTCQENYSLDILCTHSQLVRIRRSRHLTYLPKLDCTSNPCPTFLWQPSTSPSSILTSMSDLVFAIASFFSNYWIFKSTIPWSLWYVIHTFSSSTSLLDC